MNTGAQAILLRAPPDPSPPPVKEPPDYPVCHERLSFPGTIWQPSPYFRLTLSGEGL